MSNAAADKVVRRCRVVKLEVPARSRTFSHACDRLRREGVTLEQVVGVRWKSSIVALYIEDPTGEPFSPNSPFSGGERAYEELRMFVPSSKVPVAMVGGDRRVYLSTPGQAADVLRGLALLGTEGQMYELGSEETIATSIRWAYGSDQLSSGGGRVPLGWTADKTRYLFLDGQGVVYGLSADVLIKAPHELQSAVGGRFRSIGTITIPRGAQILRSSLATVGDVSEVTIELESGPLPVFKTDGDSHLNAPKAKASDRPPARPAKVRDIGTARGRQPGAP